MRRWLWTGALGLCLAGGVLAQQGEPAAEVDPLALASVLVADGHADRAALLLAEVEPAALDAAGQHLWHKLRGRILQDQGDHAGAAAEYRAALAIAVPTPRRPSHAGRAAAWDAARAEEAAQLGLLRLYAAQAILSAAERSEPSGEGAGDAARRAAASEAVALLEQAQAQTADRPGHWQLLARAQTALGRWDAAWAALEEGRRRFPAEAGFMRQQIFVLIELGLSRQAVELGGRWLDTYGATPQAVLAISEALRRSAAGEATSSQLREAQLVLEEGRLRFPADGELRRQLARVLVERDQPYAAAELLREAVHEDPELAAEAAELYRRAGRLDRALYLNSLVPDPVEKTRQRMGLLLEGGEFARVVALQPRLSRLGILSDDRVTYGLAYAHFREGAPEEAERLLQRVQDPEVFRAATELRDAMARCTADGGCP